MAEEDNDLPDLDAVASENMEPDEQESPVQPLYRIFEGSRIAVGRATGPMWQRQFEAAMKAYEHIHAVWQQCFQYYNNDQSSESETPEGVFKRGDGTENIVFSNLNIMLPAVYSKDPDISVSTTDEEDEGFVTALEALINALFKRRDKIHAKPKVKKATGMGLLTNHGILKLEFTKKDDSREMALAEMERISAELAKVKTQKEAEEVYGQLEALEQNMEVLRPSGFSLGNVLPHNLVVDPFAEQDDGMDARWMIERVFLATQPLVARYTKMAKENGEDEDDQTRVLVYKPTHKAVFAPGQTGAREDGLGLVMSAIDGTGTLPTAHQWDERQAYLDMYYTECFYVWDKATRRVMLFHRDDWQWPLWVWDDPNGTSRFFPYFIIAFSFSTGGTVSAGEVAYILDQQDELNDLNREKRRIRRALFRHFFYNSDKIQQTEAEKFIEALRGDNNEEVIIGVKAGEQKVSEVIEAMAPPAAQYDALFDKAPILESINRITNTSDALRGTQFRTNTNVASVQSYEQSMRISVGAKVDVVEDVVSDIACSVAEIAVQNYSVEDVEAIVGKKLAEGWQQMDLATFQSTVSVEVVAGSMEKPTSAFKKKEAVEIVTAVGQFADAAPATTLTIMLRVLEKAFTEVVIKPEDWDAIRQEAAARMGADQGMQGAGGGMDIETLKVEASKLPPEKQEEVIAMHEQGASPAQILQFVQNEVAALGANNGASAEPARRSA